MNQRLARVREAAKREGRQPVTALLHHVYNVDTLALAYWSLDRRAAPGVDGVTWQSYGEALEANLQDLAARLKRGGYRASPVRRVFIPKTDGRSRPLGVPTLEDKIVQRALVEVMYAIYEADFLGFSYGFRPGRRQHDALDAVTVRITTGIPKIGQWLAAVVRGHTQYFGVPGNGPRITAFRYAIGRLWYRALRRRGQNDRTSWKRVTRLIELYLPKARICHPYPSQRLRVTTRGRSPVR